MINSPWSIRRLVYARIGEGNTSLILSPDKEDVSIVERLSVAAWPVKFVVRSDSAQIPTSQTFPYLPVPRSAQIKGVV